MAFVWWVGRMPSLPLSSPAGCFKEEEAPLIWKCENAPWRPWPTDGPGMAREEAAREEEAEAEAVSTSSDDDLLGRRGGGRAAAVPAPFWYSRRAPPLCCSM